VGHVGASVGEGEYRPSPLCVLTCHLHTLEHLTSPLVIYDLIFLFKYALQTCPILDKEGEGA